MKKSTIILLISGAVLFLLFLLLPAYFTGKRMLNSIPPESMAPSAVSSIVENTPSEIESTPAKIKTPVEIVDTALQGLKNADIPAVQSTMTAEDQSSPLFGGIDLSDTETIGLFFKNLTYKTGSVKETGDTATITTEITNTNFKSLIDDFVGKMAGEAFSNMLKPEAQRLTDEQLQVRAAELIREILVEPGHPTVTTTVEIGLIKQNGEWKIKLDQTLQDAVSGGLASSMSSFSSFF